MTFLSEKPKLDKWQAEHCFVRTACAVDKPPAEYTRRSPRTPYDATIKIASAGAATESKSFHRRREFGLLK